MQTHVSAPSTYPEPFVCRLLVQAARPYQKHHSDVNCSGELLDKAMSAIVSVRGVPDSQNL